MLPEINLLDGVLAAIAIIFTAWRLVYLQGRIPKVQVIPIRNAIPSYPHPITNSEDLAEALLWIREQGWIPAVSRGPHSVGTTLELALNHPLDSLPSRDFGDTEGKAQRANTSSPMTLFTKTPIWEPGWSARRVLENYGYEDTEGHQNSLHINLYSSPRHNLRLEAGEHGILLIGDDTGEIIGTWTTERFVEGFENKADNVTHIKADTRMIDGREHFHYTRAYQCSIREDLDASNLLEEIDNGNLGLEFRMYIREDHPHCTDKGKRSGTVRDHGPAIRCRPGKIREIYDVVDLM